MGQLQFMGVLLSEETRYHLHYTVMHVQALMNVVRALYYAHMYTIMPIIFHKETSLQFAYVEALS